MPYYNASAFDAAGLAYPTAAWTLDDLRDAAQQLTRGTRTAKQYGFAATGLQTRDVFFLDRFDAVTARGSGNTLQPNFTDSTVIQAVKSSLDLLRASSPHTHIQGYTQGNVTERPGVCRTVIDRSVVQWFNG
jgi:ABC-type glycerol-3-phosphate transport system substrate-binding protein